MLRASRAGGFTAVMSRLELHGRHWVTRIGVVEAGTRRLRPRRGRVDSLEAMMQDDAYGAIKLALDRKQLSGALQLRLARLAKVIVLMASTMRRTSLALLLAACLATPGLAALPNLAWTPKYPNTTEQFTLRLVEGSVPGTLDCADTVARLSVSTDGYTLLDGFSTLKCPLTSSLTQGSGSPWACGWQPVGPCGPVPAGSYGWRVDYLSKSTGASLGYTAVSPAPRANVFMPSPQVGGPTEVRVLLTPSQSTPLRRRKDRLTIGVAVTGIKNCDPTWPVPVSIFVTDTTKLSCTLPSNANLDPTCSKLDKPITCTGLAATTTPVVLYVNAMARPDQRTYQDIPSSYLVISVTN